METTRRQWIRRTLALTTSGRRFATRLVAAGKDMRTVMSLTGHTQVSVLMKFYAQPVPEKQREALRDALEGIA
jgi:hypothetical protein